MVPILTNADVPTPYLCVVGYDYSCSRPLPMYLGEGGATLYQEHAMRFATREDAWRMLAECYAYHLATDEELMPNAAIQDYHPKVLRYW